MKSLLLPHNALRPTNFPRTRQFTRKAESEYVRIFDKINQIDLMFGEAVFESDDEYAKSYGEYLSKWNTACDYVENVLKPKCWMVDRLYFSKTYGK